MRGRRLMASILAGAVVGLTGCSSPTASTPPPPPVPDPPKITCPAPPTIQLAAAVASTPVTYGAAVTVNGKSPVTTTCTPASGSSFDVGQTTVTCVGTDALQRTDSCTFVVTVVPPPELSATSFLAFGDSLTAGESGVDSVSASRTLQPSAVRPTVLLPFNQRYPSILQQTLSGRYRAQTIVVTNAGQSGEVAADPDTFSRFTSLLATRRFGAVLIMEGSNDLFPHDSLVITRAINALGQMLRDAKSRGITPYLATIPPMNPAGFRGAAYSWDLVPEFDDRIRDLAAAEGVTLVDVYRGFNNNFDLIGVDGLHPNAGGYTKIADLFFDAIRQTLEIPHPGSAATAGRPFDGRRR